MKNLVFGLASALALGTFSAPAAHASANDHIRQQQATDPGYNQQPRYDGGGRYEPYNRSYPYYMNQYAQPMPCFLFICADTNNRKPKDGELRTLPDGTTVAYSKDSKQWTVVHQPTSQPRAVYSDRDTYIAH